MGACPETAKNNVQTIIVSPSGMAAACLRRRAMLLEPNPLYISPPVPARKKRLVSWVGLAIFDLTGAAGAASCRPCPESLRGSFSNPAMQGSLGSIIWTICYLTVLIGLSAYGVHRYVIIYLFLKNRKRAVVPAGHFDQLPRVTMQLPIFNEVYVV